MRAKLVHENMQMPFRNDSNKPISEKYPLENPNYLGDSAADDKDHPKPKYKKGDKVKYKYYHKASEMSPTSKVERTEDKVGRITKRKKGFMGRIDYEINGLTVPESYIISKVNENAPLFQEPFTNNLRNADNRGYSISGRLQYEDSDKPSPDISHEEIECEICGRPHHPGEFENGVCKDCLSKGYSIDRMGHKHHPNSRENLNNKYT
jgi:hypothetical protein